MVSVRAFVSTGKGQGGAVPPKGTVRLVSGGVHHTRYLPVRAQWSSIGKFAVRAVFRVARRWAFLASWLFLGLPLCFGGDGDQETPSRSEALEPTSLEQYLWEVVNRERAFGGAQPLAWNSELTKAARFHNA